MIIKLVILLIIVWVGLRLYYSIQNKKSEPYMDKKAQDMVRCARCGIHIPANEALKEGKNFFCSLDHLPTKK